MSDREKPVPPVYYTGLDLGQAQDPTALAVLEKTPLKPPDPSGRLLFTYACRHLQRWPLGTSYPEVVAAVGKMFSQPPLKGSVLVVDGTGVGRAVVDMFRQARLVRNLHAVTITGGHTVT